MQDLKDRIKTLSEKFGEIKKNFKLDEKKKEFSALEAESMDSDLWSNPENARSVMSKLSAVQDEIYEVNGLEEDISTLVGLVKVGEMSKDFTKEVEALETRLDKLNKTSFLSGKYDTKNAILTIHAGQGGTEAMDWTSMLYRMYLRYCERNKWTTEVLDLSAGEEAGIKSVTLKVEGTYAYGYLKGEAGTHRLVRQSPFNADKLRQTSFALVEVLPELAELDLPDIQIKDEDLEWQFFRASTQGGQNVQKVSTAVRLKHKPTGVTVTAQTERFQVQNRKIAMDLLRVKLWALEQAKEAEEKKEIKGEFKPASWGNQIRSYVLHPYKMVKDLRTDVETSNTDAVLDGDLDEFIEAELLQS
jgi:peptide chain release factor 2